MKIAKKINNKINKIPVGTTFRYHQLDIDRSEYAATAKALERLIKQDIIKRTSTGVFYKPKQSVFGDLKPREDELLKPYLYQDGKRIAYITGGSLYNRMGLTTQIPKTIKVASRLKRIVTKIGNTQVKPVKSYIDVSDDNYYLLEILDALKDFKTIPNLDKKSSIKILKNKLDSITKKDLTKLIKYGLKYPPRTKALLGAILETINEKYPKNLQKNLNPLTKYDLGITPELLPNSIDWNIY